VDLPLRTAIAAAASLGIVMVLVPPAALVATRLGLLDRPQGWKIHGRATPDVGGLVVIPAALVGAYAIGLSGTRIVTFSVCAIALCVVGTIDDRRGLRPLARVGIEGLVGVVVWTQGFGWHIFDVAAFDLALTVAWVVGVINAFNLLDLMDGVSSAIAAVVAAGVATLAGLNGDITAAIAAGALCGGCVGFLPYNLAHPSRIFLGDGGSMPIGFLVAVLVIASVPAHLGLAAFPVATLMVAIPLLDMGVRILRRIGRGISPLTPGPDSWANAWQARLRSARRVALTLAVMQGIATGLAVLWAESDSEAIVLLSLTVLLVGATAVLFDSPPRREARAMPAQVAVSRADASGASLRHDRPKSPLRMS
jgi:UDP-GlcNAc:undecaprenyl-phosphate/decaprenyl-phosphate GlcNAc-1-phosphate transferase